jgi:hypothetical protein
MADSGGRVNVEGGGGGFTSLVWNDQLVLVAGGG